MAPIQADSAARCAARPRRAHRRTDRAGRRGPRARRERAATHQASPDSAGGMWQHIHRSQSAAHDAATGLGCCRVKAISPIARRVAKRAHHGGDVYQRRGLAAAFIDGPRRVALEVHDDHVLLRPQHLREVVVAMDAYRAPPAVAGDPRCQPGRHTGPEHGVRDRTRVFGQSIPRSLELRQDGLEPRLHRLARARSRPHRRVGSASKRGIVPSPARAPGASPPCGGRARLPRSTAHR